MTADIEELLTESRHRKIWGKKARRLYDHLLILTKEWFDLEEDPSPDARKRQAEIWEVMRDVKLPTIDNQDEYNIAQMIGEISYSPEGHYQPPYVETRTAEDYDD